jgi:magnesium-transporting ATPase (P-type)
LLILVAAATASLFVREWVDAGIVRIVIFGSAVLSFLQEYSATGAIPASASLAERTNTVFLGTPVRSGTARALVTETGPRTEFGQIAGKLTLRLPETGFEQGIQNFGYLLTKVMIALAFSA